MRKILIGATFGQAYGLTFGNLGLFARVAAIPFLLIVAMNLAVAFFAQPKPPGWVPIAEQVLSFIIQVPLLTSWHRFVLLPRERALPTMGFNFTVREIRFSGYLLMMTMSLSIPLLFVSAAGQNVGAAAQNVGAATQNVGAAVLFFLVLVIVLILVWSRLCLVFPASAVGDPVRLADSWRITKGNGWRIFWLTILLGLPFVGMMMGVGMILGSIVLATKNPSALAYMSIPMTILAIGFAGVSAAAQSVVYRDLTDYDPATFEPA